ncbi:hypothetical protein IKO70_02200 [bacterium]|nr:hypothetical protein [bacterium]
MKKNSLFILFVVLLFFVGCGNGGNDYDTYGDTDSDRNDDTADSVSDEDSSDTAVNPADTDTAAQPDDDVETPDEEKDDTSETDDDAESEDFWSTCEGIIVCSNGCLSDNIDCINKCYGKGSDDAQVYYRNWLGCFNENCAEDKTAECSAENCAEWDELCNVEAAFNYKLDIPAPYGNAEFAGDFSLILNGVFPTSENQITFKSFVSGNISSIPIPPDGTIISFVKMAKDPRDGKVVEVYQVPYNVAAGVPENPVVLLRIKADSATEGTHTVGVSDESDARLIVGEVDSKYTFSCYHAFGIGSFKIDKAVIETGSAGKLSFSSGSAELFNPQNIPELGGDATEFLGVSSCSLIQ